MELKQPSRQNTDCHHKLLGTHAGKPVKKLSTNCKLFFVRLLLTATRVPNPFRSPVRQLSKLQPSPPNSHSSPARPFGIDSCSTRRISRHRLRSRPHMQLLVNMSYMCINRSDSHPEFVSNFFGAAAFGDESQHFLLASAQIAFVA